VSVVVLQKCLQSVRHSCCKTKYGQVSVLTRTELTKFPPDLKVDRYISGKVSSALRSLMAVVKYVRTFSIHGLFTELAKK
jgi:predicted amidophosphoribosyltransferase